MTKILHIIPSLGGGGAERQLAYISKGLASKGYEVHVAYLYGGTNIDRLNNSSVALHKVPCRGNHDVLIIFRIIRLILKIKPNIIQTWLPQMDVFAGLAAIVTRVPFVVSERSSELAYCDGWKDIFRVRVAKRADAVVANSKAGNDYWHKKGFKKSIFIVPNAVPVDEIVDAQKCLVTKVGVDSETDVIMFAGRYAPAKNVLHLMAALSLVLAQRQNGIALLYGEGPLINEMMKLKEISVSGDRIWIMGFSTNLWGLLKSASVFVSVSEFEGSPNTVLEAAASKCPLVVSDIPAHREILDEHSAYFVPGNSVEGIARGIVKALSNREEATQKALRAYERVSVWSFGPVIKEYEKLYEKILNCRSATRTTR